jgi:hypothetical protein
VELKGVQPPGSISFQGKPEGKMVLGGDKSNPKASLSLVANGLRPGTQAASALLVFQTQEKKDIISPGPVLDFTALFAPAPIPVTWFTTAENVKTNQPSLIDFGQVRMSAGRTGLTDIENSPPVAKFRMEIPPNAIQPPLELSVVGPNREAFLVTRIGDSVGGTDPSEMVGKIDYVIEPAHVFDPKLTRPEERTMNAHLEIRPKANFVFDVHGESGTTQTKFLSIPLQMKALLSIPEK